VAAEAVEALRARPRKRPKDSYVRFERPGPVQLWQMDIVGGIRLVSRVTGELREEKVVTAGDRRRPGPLASRAIHIRRWQIR
jgi:hypothetical protein